MSEEQINQAVTALRQGGVIAYPTEAVFGLGCDPTLDTAIQKILTLKNRPADKGLILIAATREQLSGFIDEEKISPEIQQQLNTSWPGPVTWLLPVRQHVSKLLCGKHSSIAVRVSAHPLVQKLCRAFGGAIVSTSANLAGQAPAISISEIKTQFGTSLDYVLEGELGGASKPTEIRDAVTGEIIRPAE